MYIETKSSVGLTDSPTGAAGILEDKIICDHDKTPDLSQRSPQKCPKCGNPVDDSFEPSNDNTNVVNAPREPFVVNQDPVVWERYSLWLPPKVPIIHDPEPFNNQTIKELPPTVQSFDPKSDLVHDSPNVFDPPPQLPFYSCELCGNDARYGHYCTPQVLFIYPEQCDNQDFNFPQNFQQQDLCCENCGVTHEAYQYQAANARYWKIPACYDDDDDDYAFAITPNEPDNSLSMGDEHLDTISAIESDEFIKSSVENLVPNPRIDETDCDPEEETHFVKRLLYDNSSPRPLKEFVFENSNAEIESFFHSPIPVEDSDTLMEEIDLSFTLDYPMQPVIEEDEYDSERDILIFEELLSNNSLSLPKNESFHFDVISFSRPPAKPPDGEIS
nr:hypothetical protein [Tanacetum cinerariifolium]